MRAAVLQTYGGIPSIEEFAEPQAGQGQIILQVRAAALNPVDLAIASGTFGLRRPQPPFVAGLDGVGTLPDGRHVYFQEPLLPYGSLAERAPVEESTIVPLPEGLNDVLAAALGVPGLAAWLALESRARLTRGETVLILGAGGAVGQVAVQVAKILGAGRVVAAARSDPSLARARRLGADASVRLAAGQDLRAALREAAPDGFDVVVDLTWGEPIQAAIDTARIGARIVQVGNLDGASAQISAPAFRNKLVAIIGHTNFLTPVDEKRSAITRLAEHARNGALTMELAPIPFDRIAEAWARLEAGSHRKLVVVL